MASLTKTTKDHEEIRRWAEERGAHPACVKGTGNTGDIGMLRLDFPGYSGGDSLQEISWEDFFDKFDERGLALLYQEQTAEGDRSNFNKLVSEETAEAAEESSHGRGRKNAAKSGKRATAKQASKKAAASKGASKGAASKSAAKGPAKKVAGKKTAAKKASAKKTTTKKAPAKKAATKKSAAKKGAAKTTAVKKTASKKTATKKAASKKAVKKGSGRRR